MPLPKDTLHDSVQYLGIAGITSNCLDALRRFIQFGDQITLARLVTHGSSHAVLLVLAEVDIAIIRSGFSSGYVGGGPAGLSDALRLLASRDVSTDEIEVSADRMSRLDAAVLTVADIDEMRSTNPVRPTRIHDYIDDRRSEEAQTARVYARFPAVIPYAIIDPRLLDLALAFERDPDGSLLAAFRRLEDTVRKRTRIDEHGARLFSDAFGGNGARLKWKRPRQRKRDPAAG